MDHCFKHVIFRKLILGKLQVLDMKGAIKNMRDTIIAMIDVSTGRAKAQLVFKNINLINVFTGEIYKTDVAVHDGYIAGIGEYHGAEELDMEGKYICPGFIDGHVHIESSLVTPGEFAKAVVACGTTTVVADPHEIANVKGIAGIKYMIDGAENIPLDVHLMLPSCVPATPFENSGSELKAEDLLELINHPRVLGLGELMDFPNVLSVVKNPRFRFRCIVTTYCRTYERHVPRRSSK